jgi:alkanesulfonate monooxygenase SsuD/methylene tetrahydromethanopterin reductase-like flavin-dependent oxidoreductase (luciferase family)
MREYVEVVRRLLAMKRVTFHGDFVNVDDIELDIVTTSGSRRTCRSTSAPPG